VARFVGNKDRPTYKDRLKEDVAAETVQQHARRHAHGGGKNCHAPARFEPHGNGSDLRWAHASESSRNNCVKDAALLKAKQAGKLVRRNRSNSASCFSDAQRANVSSIFFVYESLHTNGQRMQAIWHSAQVALISPNLGDLCAPLREIFFILRRDVREGGSVTARGRLSVICPSAGCRSCSRPCHRLQGTSCTHRCLRSSRRFGSGAARSCSSCERPRDLRCRC
jgi:hypothetical protein